MSKFGNMASSAHSAHAHYFADQVILAQPGSAPATVDAVVGKVRTESRTDASGHQERVSLRTLRFIALTDVRHDSTVTIDDQLWSIDQFVKRSASGLTVDLIRVQTHQIARPNYRGKA